MHEGVIYFYPGYVGQVQDSNKVSNRHKVHLKKYPERSEPIILERVTGKDRKDLLFNLCFQETIWIFKHHTYRPIWPEGLNLILPNSRDAIASGRLGGLMTGPKVGKQNVESGHLARLRTPEHQSKAGRNGALKVRKLYPDLGQRAMHIRWHLNRGIKNPSCKFCQVVSNG